MKQELPTLPFGSADEWERWLAEHHAASQGVWLKIAKKGSGTPTVTYAEAVDTALCFGWIDGQKRPFDESFWLQRFTPRGPRSKWSRINRDKVAVLLETDRMRPAGLAEVERAQADGRWDAAYEPQSTATVPDDLQRALDGNASASAFFSELDGANRYAILYRIQEAKRPETRTKRIANFVAMLERRETLHPIASSRRKTP